MGKQVLVVKEKHGTLYYDVSTPEQLHAVALSILQSRYDEGYWYTDYTEDEYSREQERVATLTDEEIDALPGGYLKQEAKNQRTWAQEYVQMVKNDMSCLKLIKKALETQDGALAWRCLDYRTTHEYESVTLEWLRDAGE